MYGSGILIEVGSARTLRSISSLSNVETPRLRIPIGRYNRFRCIRFIGHRSILLNGTEVRNVGLNDRHIRRRLQPRLVWCTVGQSLNMKPLSLLLRWSLLVGELFCVTFQSEVVQNDGDEDEASDADEAGEERDGKKGQPERRLARQLDRVLPVGSLICVSNGRRLREPSNSELCAVGSDAPIASNRSKAMSFKKRLLSYCG
jgi:hypothetical protein